MNVPPETPPEETPDQQYANFIRLLTAIAAVPKSAIYDLDPSLRPKPRSRPPAPGDDPAASE